MSVLYVCGQNDVLQQKTRDIEEDVALSNGDFLACVAALGASPEPLFATPALWRSMIATVGFLFLPACSRAAI